jgi:hypothetical protein
MNVTESDDKDEYKRSFYQNEENSSLEDSASEPSNSEGDSIEGNDKLH